MIFRDRSDGRRVRDLTPFQEVVPYLMRKRVDSVVYFSYDIDVEHALRYIKRLNSVSGLREYSLFALLMSAVVRVLALKPKMNRFVSGRGIFQRNQIALSFIVKKRLDEDSPESDAKIYFEREDTIFSVTKKMNDAITKARSDELSADEKEMAIITKIPGMKAIVASAFLFLDRLNIAPRAMIRSDPLFTSAFVANLASIGLDTPFHHLYEWGNASLFIIFGKMFLKDVKMKDGSMKSRHFVNLKVSIDERISEGIYYAHSLDLFRRIVLNPEVLEGPPEATDIAKLSAFAREPIEA